MENDRLKQTHFFITCMEKLEKDSLGWLDTGSSRVFGMYPEFEMADEALKTNRCDMCETIYGYAVVEEIGYGIHPDVENRWFYKWDSEKHGFFPIDEPEIVKRYCNFSIG